MKAHFLFTALRALLFASLLAVFPAASYAQIPQEDLVQLKDGSVIRGEIRERVVGEHIRIELLGGTVLVIKEENILYTERANKLYGVQIVRYDLNDWRFRRSQPITARPKGFYNLFTLNFSTYRSSQGFGTMQPNVHYRFGYRFSQYLNLGMGIGLDPMPEGGVTSIYADYHGDIGKTAAVQPHYFVQAGYGAGAWENWDTEDFRGGAMGHFGFGVKLNTRSRAEWIFTIGYRLQQADFITRRFEWPTDPFGNPVETREAVSTLYNGISFQATLGI